MIAIFKREFVSYFKSPIGYVFLAVMYAFGGIGLFECLSYGIWEMQYVSSYMSTAIMFIMPIITMRLLSEDKRLKTDQLLLTAPVEISSIIIGKYLAAFIMFLLGTSVALVIVLVLGTYAEINWSLFLGNIIGLVLLGGSLISVGIFVSGMTESQIVAAVVSYVAIFFLRMAESIAIYIPSQFSLISTILQELAFFSRFSSMLGGSIKLENILFFISLIVIFNFLAIRVVEKRRWS